MSNKLKVLSFDVSSFSTGWALIINNKPKKYGVISLDKKLTTLERLIVFRLAAINILCSNNPDFIVIEETYLKNVKTLKVLMQFIGVLSEACLTIVGKQPIIISPQTVRSHFKVKNKEEAFEFINKKYKLKMKFENDNDISDAILQGLYYYDFLKERNNGE